MYCLRIRITAYILSFIVFATGIFSVFSISVNAGTTSDLYGTGSADDINIVKLLDLALNRGGMSMSPSTIKAFLEYWYGAVKSDLTTCINNAASTITTTQAFADYVISALSNTEHYDQLGNIMTRYVQYALTMGSKSVSDFKQLLLQEGTFRKFLLSYVTDENGNIVNTVKPLKTKYKTNGEFVNMVRDAADAFIEEHEGFYLIRSYTYKDLLASTFLNSNDYNYVRNAFQTIPDNGVILYAGNYPAGQETGYCQFYNVTSFNLVVSKPKSSSRYLYVDFYDNVWQKVINAPGRAFGTRDFSGSLSFKSELPNVFQPRSEYVVYAVPMDDGGKYHYNFTYPFTMDGRMLRVWKSLDALKSYNFGQCNIYYSNTYSSYDYSADNSITFTGQYFTSNNYSHTTIQNNIDNSQETISETTVNNIVNNYITNNYYGVDDDNPGYEDDPGSNDGLLTDIITGISQIPTALLSGLEELFTKLFVPSEGFADPIKDKINAKFYFIGETHSDIVGLVDRLEDMGSTAPTITFPLSKTPFARYGVQDITVSFEWFEPYRMQFQLLISAIMWAMFLFSQFFGLKNLIQGTDSAVRAIM